MRNLLLYSLLCFIWGSTWIAIKIGLQDAPPMWSVAFRFLLAAGLLLVLNLVARRSYPRGWRGKWKVAVPGFFTYAASYSLTYLGTQYIPAGLASVIFAIFPFFVLILMSVMIDDERATVPALIGVALGFIGIIVIFLEPVAWSEHTVLGMVLLLFSPLSAALGTVWVKKWLRDEPVIPMITLQMSLGAIVLVVMALLFEDIHRFQFTTASVGSVLYLAILGSIITFAGYFWLLQRMKLVSMSLIALLTPLISVYMGWLILDEILSPRDYFGAALVLSGVGIVIFGRRREETEAAATAPSSET